MQINSNNSILEATKTKKSQASKKLFTLFILLNIFVSVDIKNAEAFVFENSIYKIKSIFDLNDEEAEEIDKNKEDTVIRLNSKNIIEKDKSNNKIAFMENGDEAISVAVGPLRTATEEEIFKNDTIQIYEVKKGDTIEDIAKLYDVNKNTIIWANDIKGGKAKEGEILIILPVDGVQYKIKKGDTLKNIAKKYKADIDDIKEFNNIKNDDDLALNDEIIIPNGELYIDSPKKVIKTKSPKVYPSAGSGYYTRPIIGGRKTQGIHGHNAIDFGAPIGTAIVASADGVVQVAKLGGWNGGYGSMIIISHPNGTQTLYAHLSSINIKNGQKVIKGEQIGLSGNTGKSTGPHLHFEIRGATNPF